MKLMTSCVFVAALILSLVTVPALATATCPANACPDVLDGYAYVGTCVGGTHGNPCLGWIYQSGSEVCSVSAESSSATVTVTIPETEDVSEEVFVDQMRTEQSIIPGGPVCTTFAVHSSSQCNYSACVARGCGGGAIYNSEEYECECGYAY